MKHGRKDVPFTRLPGHVFNDGNTQLTTMQYVIYCQCGAAERISASKNLPDEVAIQKFEAAGWEGVGHARPGVPRRMRCPTCITRSNTTESPMSQTLHVHSAFHEAKSSPKASPAEAVANPDWVARHPSLTSLVQEAFDNGADNRETAMDYIKSHYSGIESINTGSVSSIMSVLRSKAGLPRRKIRARSTTAEQWAEALKAEEPEVDAAEASAPPAKSLATLFADGFELRRMLLEWAREMEAHGVQPVLRVEDKPEGGIKDIAITMTVAAGKGD